jgi:hypothetical protein
MCRDCIGKIEINIDTVNRKSSNHITDDLFKDRILSENRYDQLDVDVD